MIEFAKFYCCEEVSDIQQAAGGYPFPEDFTFMAAQIVVLNGRSWDCRRPGLYRWKVAGQPYFRNRIVYGTAANPDVYATLSACSWNHVHGAADEGTDYQVISNRGRFVRWRLRCGYICGLMNWLLPQFGKASRVVGVETLGPRTGYDDGHAVLEVMIGGQWRMFDMDMGCYWKDASGNHLSVSQFIAHIANGGVMPERVKLDGTDRRWDTETIPGGTFDMGLYGENFIGTPAQEEAWFRRIFQKLA